VEARQSGEKSLDFRYAVERGPKGRHQSFTEWLGKIKEAGVRLRAERLYQQLDVLQYALASAPRAVGTRGIIRDAIEFWEELPLIR
jgi:hypothetical protein